MAIGSMSNSLDEGRCAIDGRHRSPRQSLPVSKYQIRAMTSLRQRIAWVLSLLWHFCAASFPAHICEQNASKMKGRLRPNWKNPAAAGRRGAAMNAPLFLIRRGKFCLHGYDYCLDIAGLLVACDPDASCDAVTPFCAPGASGSPRRCPVFT